MHARPMPQLSDRAAQGSSSAIRDLLDQAKRPGMISLAGGLPDPTLFPTEALAVIAQRLVHDHGQEVLQYGVTAGAPEVRRALIALFGASTGTGAERLVVTTGSQQALDLIARTVVNPGDQVVVGDPDYLGGLQVFRSYGADLRPIAIDVDGMDTAQLEHELQRGLRPTCCYIVPHFHNPTGATMSAERREHLDGLSQQFGFLVIEDDPYCELFYGGVAPAEHAGDPELTVQLRSTSKTLAPGLRIGVLSGPDWLTDPLITAKQSVDLHTSSLSQAIVAEVVASSWFGAHLNSLRQAYGLKRDALIAALKSNFGDQVEMATPAGGMFLWVRFVGIGDTRAWLSRCLDQGVCFVPGSAFAVRRDLDNYARLSFATGSVAELTEAVARMQAA